MEQPFKMPVCSPQQIPEVKCDNSFMLLSEELSFIHKSVHWTKSNEVEGTIDSFLAQTVRRGAVEGGGECPQRCAETLQRGLEKRSWRTLYR